MGRRKQKVSTGEGTGGQTHWLAEEERSGKRDSRENTRKSDSWLCPTSLLYIRRGALISAWMLLFRLSQIGGFHVLLTNANTIRCSLVVINLIRNFCVPIKKIINLCTLSKEAKRGFPRLYGTFSLRDRP